MFDYYVPTKVLFGYGQLDRLHEQALPGRKTLIVMSAGGSARKNGYLERVEKQLALAGVASVPFEKILTNPSKKHVMEGAALARQEGCDFIMALGGGSSIDAAKAIAIVAVNEGDYWDYVAGGSGKAKPIKNDPLPVVTISTTSGTGSEADPWAVITDEDLNEKIGFGYDKTFPVLSIMDPELTLSVPPVLTSYQGFDALFHSAEGYLCNTAFPISDLYSLKAVSLVGEHLETVIKDGQNRVAREGMALANLLSGMVQSTSSCISQHSMEHAMSANHHTLPHGAGLVMLSRAYFTHWAKCGAVDARMVDMAKALGKTDAKVPMDFVDALVDLEMRCGVADLKMSDYGITRDELPALAKKAKATMGGLFECDPVPMSDEECVAIYAEAFR